jgi:transglutaminase-like putative cysteine protease
VDGLISAIGGWFSGGIRVIPPVLGTGSGWVDCDPTNKLQPGETYVKIAVGRDYADVGPISGHYVGSTERSLDVSVQIRAVE